MAETYRLTGQDTIVLWGRVLSDFADGDIATIAVDNNITYSSFSIPWAEKPCSDRDLMTVASSSRVRKVISNRSSEKIFKYSAIFL